ncbi:hypothetical protein DFQ27_008450 [Actinomortierella ambigua]|uniref:Uncharacterized protein n=1 Tax=Actinomortierella ambigua TaxID=1343610 RepID=A0A9P6UBF9_9FUNG|nr:hypothetical protein DFQ27_008450 [Actinomortierella ambigua]
MAHRRLRRRAHGQYRKNSSRRWLFSAFVIAVFMSLVGIGAQKLDPAASWPQVALVVAILLIMVYVVVKVSILVRWCFYWLVLATLVLFVMNKGDLLSSLPTSATQDGLRAKIVLIVLAFLELLTISLVLFNRIVYPRIVLRGKFLNARWWWKIRDVKEPESSSSSNYKTVAFSFSLWDQDEYQISRGMVSYTGEFDEQGRPHGLGLWKEGTYTGEALQGIWEHGVPIGPFKSQEYGTGNAFSSLRVGFCKNSSDPDNRTTWNSQRDPKGVSYGAATVECSVSGKFFQHLPFVRINAEGIYRSDIVKAAEEDLEAPTTVLSYALEHLTTYAESLQSRPTIGGSSSTNLLKKVAPLSRTIVIRYTDRGLDIPGYIKTRRRRDHNEVVIRRVCPPSLGVEGHQLGVSSSSRGEGSTSPPSATNTPVLLLPTDPRNNDDSDNDSQDERSSSEMDRSDHRLSTHDTIESAGHRPQRPMRERRKQWDQAGLVVQGWRQVLDAELHSSTAAYRAGFSALVFIHGYNCSLTYGVARLAQLLSLGEFPPYVKPFVFSWPSSVTMGYFHALKVGCSDVIAKDFRQFIQDLRASGFRRVHILAHSMGARVFLAALRKGALDGILAEREVVSVDDDQLSDNQSASGLNPRVSVRYKDSRNGQGHFPDQKVQRGYSVESMESDNDRPIQLATMTLMNPDADLEIFLDEDYWILSKYCPHITLYADARDGALFWSQVLGRKKSLGRHPRTLTYPPTGEILDVDVIDTTSLDVNVHSIRHNFFNLNRMLVDDLYDIVVLGRRARERQGRLSNRWTFSDDGVEDGEVFTFLCAPSYVVNA